MGENKENDKLYNTRKKIVTIVILIIGIIVVAILITTNENSNKTSDMSSKIPSQQNTSLHEYISNNKYNSKFSSYDIEEAEEAIYNKYDTKEAEEKILNQKIYIKIKQIVLLDEREIHTAINEKKEYIYSLTDYDNNSWIYIGSYYLEDGSYNIKTNSDLILYGTYLGMYNYKEVQYPQIDVFEVRKNLDILDKESEKNIANSFIIKLKEKYPNETFSFSNFVEKSKYCELEYKNINEDLKITFIINDNKIKMACLYVKNINNDIYDIDQDFVKSFLICFDSKITKGNVEKYLVGAKESELDFRKNVYNQENYKYKLFSLNNIICQTFGNLENMNSLCVYYE